MAQLGVSGPWVVDYRLSQRLANPFCKSDPLSASDSLDFQVLFLIQEDL